MKESESSLGIAGARVIVADDDDRVRCMVRLTLEKAGYRVSEAEDGNRAIELVQQEPPDAVITDILMPEKEGIETIREIRRVAPSVRIIAISGGGVRVDPDVCLQIAKMVGADRVLLKPFDSQELLRLLRDIIGIGPRTK